MKTDKYVGNYVTGENYDQFAKDFVSDVRAMLKKDAPDWKIAKKYKGWFYLSMFLQNEDTGEYMYLNTGDVRYFKDWWHDRLLIRTAKSDEDYTGGVNHEIKFNELPKFLNMNYEHIAQIRDENYLDKLQYA